jgi:hypothetical protein
MSAANLPAASAPALAAKPRKPHKPPRPLPPDIHQKLGWSIEEVMALTHQGRPAVMEKITDGTYPAQRNARGDWVLKPDGVRKDMDEQFDRPPQLVLPSGRKRGRPSNEELARRKQLKTADAAPKPKRRYRRKSSMEAAS